MKVQVQGSAWPAHMKGRELTVYIFRYDPRMERQDVLPKGVFSKADEQTWAFWEAFRRDAEAAFAEAGLQAQGLADGDLPLGVYSSIRNESFCTARDEWQLPESWHGIDLGARPGTIHRVYPPNAAGWNAAQHPVPWPWTVRSSCWCSQLQVAIAVALVSALVGSLYFCV